MIFLILSCHFLIPILPYLRQSHTKYPHIVFLPKIWYSRIILHKRSLHVTRERNESCFSPSTASDSYFLHRRWSWYCNILYLGLSGGYLALQGNPICLYPTGGYLGATTLLSFCRFCRRFVPIIPGALTSVAGVFIYGHIIGTIYNYIGIVIGCAIIFYLVRLYGAPFVQSMVSKRTYDQVYRLAG